MIAKITALLASLISVGACAQGPYVLTLPLPAKRLGCWTSHFPEHNEIVGYSSLGHFFLRSKASKDYIVLHPYRKAAKSYGAFDSVRAFQKAVLDDEGFSAYVLRPDHVAEISRRLGALKKDEVYIPAPYPFLGGSEQPDSYDKGNVWMFMDVVAQMQGLCD